MPKLEVKVRYQLPDTIPAKVSIMVADAVPPAVRKVAGGEYDTTPATVPVNMMPWAARIPVKINNTKKVPGYAHHGISPVLFIVPKYDNHLIHRRKSTLQVLNAQLSATRIVKPADDTTTDQGDTSVITEVNLDFDLSFDSYFKFMVSSDDGIRAVLNEEDVVIPSGGTGYEVEAAKVGDAIKRKVITNSDFQLTLNLKPTIVKNRTI